MKLPLVLIEGIGPICINDADGQTMCDSLIDVPTGEAIVRAVNSHDALVEALKVFIETGAGHEPDMPETGFLHFAFIQARDALAKVKR